MTQESLPPDSSRAPFSTSVETAETHTLKVTLSGSLYRKLQYKAQGESISMEELARELLA